MLTVINYHYIRENFDSKYPSIFGVTPSGFKKQLLLMKNEGEFLHQNEIIGDLEKVLHSNNNYFLITFDDGLKEQFDLALAILEDIKVSAVFFVNSLNFDEKKVSTVHKIHLLRSVIDSEIFLKSIQQNFNVDFSEAEKIKSYAVYRYDSSLNAELKYILNFKLTFREQEVVINKMFDLYFNESEVLEKLYMNHQNLVDLANKGLLGSHTHSHYPLGLTDIETIKFELENSKRFLESATNSNINMVSYPYGTDETCTEQVAVIAKKAGYKLGFTTNRGSNIGNEDHLLLKRFDCNDLPGGKNN